ncbi:MAG: hypothetical protein NTV51_06950 [Verrucomicrobia bacterium]|nr:hypothetical protein [Verrucomicrobiota bacterium]
MIDAPQAARLARAHAAKFLADGITLGTEGILESPSAWFFPWHHEGPPVAGSKGFLIEKATGRVHPLGSAYSAERDLKAFDAGYRFGHAWLVVTHLRDPRHAEEALRRLKIHEVTPEVAHGVEWRVPHLLTLKEIRTRLTQLPAKFGPIPVYFAVEELDEMRRHGEVTFVLENIPE